MSESSETKPFFSGKQVNRLFTCGTIDYLPILKAWSTPPKSGGLHIPWVELGVKISRVSPKKVYDWNLGQNLWRYVIESRKFR